jgi:hypothetical protein
VKNANDFNELIKFLTSEVLNSEGIARIDAFMKLDLKNGVEKYRPNDPDAFDRLYTDELMERDKACVSLLKETVNVIKQLQ